MQDYRKSAGAAVKARLRADLRTAMKGRHTLETKLVRALVAAIDSAEAPAIQAAQTDSVERGGSAEIERLLLSRSDVRRVLAAEIHERERAAEELERLGLMDRAELLRAEVRLAKRYLE